MAVSTVQKNGRSLHIRRLNTPYTADIKSGVGLWLGSLIPLGGLELFSLTLHDWLRQTESTPPALFMPFGDLILLALLSALMMAVYLADDFFGLLSPRTFDFDRDQNAFLVDGKKICSLDRLCLRLQDGFGPSRRAFRLVVTARGRDYVIARTRRVTASTLVQKEYPGVVSSEGLQRKYWFHQWADYTGAKTGFSPDWPDYREIFEVYAELTKFVPVLETREGRRTQGR